MGLNQTKHDSSQDDPDDPRIKDNGKRNSIFYAYNDEDYQFGPGGDDVTVMAVWPDDVTDDVTRRLWFQTAPLTRSGHVLGRGSITPGSFDQLKLRIGELCLVQTEEGWLRAQVLSTESQERRVSVRIVHEEYEEEVPVENFAREPSSVCEELPSKFVLAGARLGADETLQSRAAARLSSLVCDKDGVRQRVLPGGHDPLASLHVRMRGTWRDVTQVLAHEGLVTATHARRERPKQDGYLTHLLMLLLLRVRNKLRGFELAAYFKPAGVLGDLYFRFQQEDGSWVNLYVKQHLENTDNQFVLKDNLKDMFLSYVKLPEDEGRNICVLYTNKSLESLETVDCEFHKMFNYPNIFFGNLQEIKDNDIATRLVEETKMPKELVLEFLKDFIFATDQPNEKRLIKIVESEINEFCGGFRLDCEKTYPILLKWIQNWILESDGTYIDYKSIQEKFDSLQPTLVEGIIDTSPRQVMIKFYDRIRELSQVCTISELKKQSHFIDVAIIGPPGVGKTELALKCLESQTGKYHHTIWINADCANSIHNDFQDLAIRLKIIDTISDKRVDKRKRTLIRERIYQVLAPYKCIFVFDNSPCYDHMKMFMPSVNIDTSRMFVFVTSHGEQWPANLTLPIHVFTGEPVLESLPVKEREE